MFKVTKAYRLKYTRTHEATGDVSECSAFLISKSKFEELVNEWDYKGKRIGYRYKIEARHRSSNSKSKTVDVPPDKHYYDQYLRVVSNN